MSYQIVSWDVGIKNLAYCQKEVSGEDNSVLKILDWGIVNLVSEDEHHCTQKKASQATGCCGKRASYFNLDLEGKKHYSCGTHKKQLPQVTESWLREKIQPAESGSHCRYESSRTGKVCGKKARSRDYQGIHLCTAHLTQRIKKILKESTPQKVKRTKVTRKETYDLCHNLVTKLDALSHLWTADEVLIENQPTLKNPTMKTVASFLFNYFMVRGVVDQKRTVPQVIKFISPCNKLKVNNDRTVAVLSKASKADQTYRLTKELSVKYTQMILQEEKKWLEHLATYKKKDDLCDAFLQGYYYLCTQKRYSPPPPPELSPEKPAPKIRIST